MRHTLSFARYKDQVAEIWNFAAMICYAVPALSKNIKGVELKVENYARVKPDYFINDKSSLATLKELTKGYRAKLAAHLWLSSFSFFEAYVQAVVRELVEFHGGEEQFVNKARQSTDRAMKSLSAEMSDARGKLREPPKQGKTEKYSKYARVLKDGGYRFPSELLSAYGVRTLIAELRDLRAVEIPDMLRDGLHVPLSDAQVGRFISYKDIRNNIAHGRPGEHSLRDVLEMSEELRAMARIIDQHLLKHFYVQER